MNHEGSNSDRASTMHNCKRFNACLVCGHPLFANGGSVFENSCVLRHKNCSKNTLLLALHKQAEALGLAPLDLLTQRLAELYYRIIQALGDVSLEQFHTTEPEGHLLLLLPGSDLKVRAVFSPHFQSEAIYHEVLMTPGELQQQKTRLLARIKDATASAAGTGHNHSAEHLMASELKNGEDHWNGRKKEEIALEILITERLALKILASAGMDRELASRPFLACPAEFREIAGQVLSTPGDEVHLQATITKNKPTEVV